MEDGQEERVRRDPYVDWPYAIEYLLDTLDPELIEGHARQILSRSLNIGRLVAFVGAGVSMSYGRMAWRALVDAEIKRVRGKLFRHLQTLGKEKDEPDPTGDWNLLEAAGHTHVARLQSVLNTLNLDGGRDVKADRYPMMFQLCEQLDAALTLAGASDATDKFRAHAEDLTVDDRGHQDQILDEALETRDLDPTSDDALAAGAELNRRRQEAHAEQERTDLRSKLFTVSALETLIADLTEAERVPLKKALLGVVERRRRANAELLTPTERYTIGVALRLTSDRKRVDWLKSSLDGPAPVKTRGGLVPTERDPLLLLQDQLQVSRFITTNYDKEIERLFIDQDFRDGSEADAGPSLLRPRFTSMVFDNDMAGELVAFAAADRHRTGEVVHLHGLAGSGTHGKPGIIVTETDYQRLYLRTDDTRDLVDNSIRLAFGGNPMLFVGSNMGEDDILRPLRQFMSGPSRVGDRAAVALVPATEERSRRIEEKITHLGRYGVYTIHFGNAGIREIESGKEVEVEWLPWFSKIRRQTLEALSEARLSRFWDDVASARQVCGSHQSDSYTPSDAIERHVQMIRSTVLGGPLHAPMAGRGRGASAVESPPREPASRLDPIPAIFAPVSLEGIAIAEHEGLDIKAEILVLDACVQWLSGLQVALRDPIDDRLARRYETEAEIHRVALDGANDAVLASFTCARLMRAQRDWEGWKADWFRLPNPRAALNHSIADRHSQSLLAADAHIVHRHRIDLAVEVRDDHDQTRFYAGAPSQTLYGLIEAMDLPEAERFRAAEGRRTLVLKARRGVGKGHFFSALQDCTGKSGENPRVFELLAALKPKTRTKRSRDKASAPARSWIGAAFFNLSFAHEVMSVFDRLTSFLTTTLRQRTDNPVAIEALLRAESLGNDRVERFRSALQAWASLKDPNPPRLLIVFNSVGILFDTHGLPKNGQVKRLFDVLLGSDFAAAPIDIVLTCQDSAIPLQFRLEGVRRGSRIQFLPRDRQESAAASVRTLSEKRKAPWLAPADQPADATRAREADVLVHELHEARASLIVAAYFPRIGLLLARSILGDDESFARLINAHRSTRAKGRPDTKPSYPNFFEDRAAPFRDSIRKTLSKLRPGHGSLAPHHVIPTVTVMLAVLLEAGVLEKLKDDKGGFVLEANLDRLTNSLIKKASHALKKVVRDKSAAWGWLEKQKTEAVQKVAVGLLLEEMELAGDSARAEIVRAGLIAALGRYDARLKSLRDAVGGNRFLLTLLFSAAHEVTTELSVYRASGRESETIPLAEVEKAANRVVEFLDGACRALRGTPVRRHSDVVIDLVLGVMHRRHDHGAPLPVGLAGMPPAARKATKEGYHLLNELLWHLSIIGQPVEADVLLWCPRVRSACEAFDAARKAAKIGESPAEGQNPGRKNEGYEALIRETLDLAVHRCLVFRLTPHRDGSYVANAEDEASEAASKRYSIHRLMQRNIFQKLGAPDVEFADADQFTVSLYASQPDELPRLRQDGHKQIATVISALAGYPGDQQGAEQHSALEIGLRKRLLRAAFGVMRSIYSVGVITRLDHKSAADDGAPGHEGYLEQHRRIVRWLLNAAVDLDRADQEFGGDKQASRGAAPFYAEEIVWLYNETAVLSLTQGKLFDAQALFEAALLAAKRIEQSDTGALHVRILLNKAVVAIERGQGASVRADLERIAALTDEHLVPPLLAKGYLGLLDHLAGEISTARSYYDGAIGDLVKLGRSRAASIFSRHCGDLLRNVRNVDQSEARQLLENAVHLAQKGGHEDVRHLALMSLMKLRMASPEAETNTDFHRELDAIERYARVVGMPRLLCEVHQLRATLLMKQGETRLAASLVTDSLEIACTNDLRLRKVTSLLLLAEINLKRDQVSAARPLLTLGVRLAKATNHHFALSVAQSAEHLARVERPKTT